MADNGVHCDVDVTYGETTHGGLPVSIGVPFPAGVCRACEDIAIETPDGDIVAGSGRPLSRWADGSLRWALVHFRATQAGRHRLQPESPVSSSENRVRVAHEKGRWVIDSDRLHLAVNETGPALISSIECDGTERLATADGLRLSVNDASTRHESRRSVRVIDSTPQYARLRVTGGHYRRDRSRLLTYRLDIHVWQGWPAVRLDYHYFHCEPDLPSVRIERVALDADWNLGTDTARHFIQRNYGLNYVTRHVVNPDPVALVADLSRGAVHVEDPTMLRDEIEYPFYLHPPLVDTHDWLGTTDGNQSVCMTIQDFLEARPNRLFSQENTLGAELWPSTAEAFDLPQGRSRRQAVVLAFPAQASLGSGTQKLSNAPKQAPKGVAALLNAPLQEGRAAVSPDWVASCRQFHQQHLLPRERHVRFENNLSSLVRLDMPVTKFDVGDTASHYTRGLEPLEGAPHIPRFSPGRHPTQTYRDLHEPVWTNNEYDAIHAVASELMRTGRDELWNPLRLAARHNIEVDFLHYSDHNSLHRATPAHSVRHTTTGAYPSHFWTEGLLEYYCLTGDPDALEVALALGDKTVEHFSDPDLRAVAWGFNREIGWSVLLLSCLVDVAGEPRFRPLLDEMIDYLTAFDRHGFSGGISLSNGNDRQNLHRQMVGNFFGYGSMLEGVDLYADLSGRDDVSQWLAQLCYDLAREAMNAAREGHMPGINFSVALAIGYERTGDTHFLDLAGLVLDAAYWNNPGADGRGTAKAVASLYRGLPRLLGHAWKHGVLDRYEFPSVRAIAPAQNDPRTDAGAQT